MRLLITGASGMLGSALVQVLSSHYPSIDTFAYSRTQLDVTDSDAVFDLFASIRPNIVIHAAANTNADFCEKNPLEASAVLLNGTRNIALACLKFNTRIVFPQSFLIYGPDGTESDICNESTVPNPLSVYARLKHEAETEILAMHPDVLILRMSGFFGGQHIDKNFVGKLHKQLLHLHSIGSYEYCVGSRVWQPTYTHDLALTTIQLAMDSQHGIWCVGSPTACSFFTLASEVVSLAGLDHLFTIKPADDGLISSQDIAKRPRSVLLDMKKLSSSGYTVPRPWSQSLREYLSNGWFVLP